MLMSRMPRRANPRRTSIDSIRSDEVVRLLMGLSGGDYARECESEQAGIYGLERNAGAVGREARNLCVCSKCEQRHRLTLDPGNSRLESTSPICLPEWPRRPGSNID